MKDANSTVSSKHLPALDGVRGMAILLVMVIHFFPSDYKGGVLLVTVGRLVGTGWVGVDLFFVLSGFLITGILLDTIGQPGYFRNFYAKRTLRIFPLYYGVIVSLLLLTPLLHFNWQGKAPYFLLYLQNFLEWEGKKVLYIAPFIELGHFWSLAIEEQFYLVWPALIAVCRTPRQVAWISGSMIICILIGRGIAVWSGVNLSTIYHGTYFRIDSLAFGALLASTMKMVPFARLVRPARAGFVIGLGLFATLLFWMNTDWKDSPVFAFAGYTGLGLFFSCLIVLSLDAGSPLSRLFNLQALRFMGKYSYGLYVWHLLFFPYFALYLHPLLNMQFGSKILGGIATGLSGAAVAFILAIASYHFFEKKFLSLKRFFDFDRPVDAAVANESETTPLKPS